jgi:hypothetical protein
MGQTDELRAGVNIKEIAFALDLKPTQVGSTLANHIKNTGPNAKVARVKAGVYRLTSAAERSRKAGRERKAKTLKKIVDATSKTVGEAVVNGELTSSGWVAPASDGPELAAFEIKRGGITFPPALAAGLTMNDATVVHVELTDASDNRGAHDVYFVWRGRMWKGYQI